ncbi:hypothetical protein HZ326_15594 [Fusarium oxysporum f. sp. albedinis]|nr:hypothetical protein HZ326_15594 [Fusarium oxysporum f. sp. albedinis]
MRRRPSRYRSKERSPPFGTDRQLPRTLPRRVSCDGLSVLAGPITDIVGAYRSELSETFMLVSPLVFVDLQDGLYLISVYFGD